MTESTKLSRRPSDSIRVRKQYIDSSTRSRRGVRWPSDFSIGWWGEEITDKIARFAARFVRQIEPPQPPSWEVSFIHSIIGKDDTDEDTVVVLADGTMRKYIACRGVNALLYEESERQFLARQFANLANGCECDLQIIVVSRNLPVDDYLAKYQTQIRTSNQYLQAYADYTDRWFRRMQEVQFVPQRDFYVVVSHTPKGCGGSSWNGKRTQAEHDSAVEALNRTHKSVIEQLRLATLHPEPMTRKQIRNLIYSTLNPKLSKLEADAPPPVPTQSEASRLSRSSIKILPDCLVIDGEYVGTQIMTSFPHETWMGWLAHLMTVNVEYTLSIFIHQCDQEKVRKQLKADWKKGFLVHSGFSTPDIDESEATSERAAVIREFFHSSSKAFDVSAYITTHAPTKEALLLNMDELRCLFQNRGANIGNGVPFMVQFEAWQSCLPVGVDKLAHVHRVLTPVIGTLFPFFTAACGTPDGVPFGFALASREPVLLDPFYRGRGKDANNMFVVGTTGAGKSFAISMMILRLLPLGMRFVLIDKTIDKFGAYRFITELLGSEFCEYIDLGPSTGAILNPFDLGVEEDPFNPSAKKITNLLSLLDVMLSTEGREELDIEQKSILDLLLRLTYRRAAGSRVIPTMSNLVSVTEEVAEVENNPRLKEYLQWLAKGLTLFTKSSAFGGLLDGLTNINTDKPFIVFDTREVNDPRLERITAFILAEFVTRKAKEYKERRVKFAAIIDEAATLMRFKAGARLLDDLARRARHYGMMLVCITQQLKDFMRQSDLADSVIKNSHMKLLLRQDASDLAVLRDTLKLTDAEVRSIENFSRDDEKRKESQCLLIVGGTHGTVRLVPSPMDYWVCTSEPIYDVPTRHSLIETLKEQNPKLSDTQCRRLAVAELAKSYET